MKDEGHRASKTRTALVALFTAHPNPLSVPEIEILLTQKKYIVNKTTIYREIEKLLNHNVIKEVYLRDDKVRYELADTNHHHHIVCIECKKIEDVTLDQDVKSYEQTIAKKFKYKILDHSLEFFGLCQKCQK